MTAARKAFWTPVVIAAAAAISVAVIGGTLTDTGPWYQKLRKPSWQPPGWLLAPAWTIIFALATASAVLGWRASANRAQREWLIFLFALNGFLNMLWSLLFFALRRPDWALIEVAFLWLSILLLIVTLWPRSRPATYCLMPYLVWVSFAAVLNWSVVRLNAPFA